MAGPRTSRLDERLFERFEVRNLEDVGEAFEDWDATQADDEAAGEAFAKHSKSKRRPESNSVWKYKRSEKCKAARRRYWASPKGRECMKRQTRTRRANVVRGLDGGPRQARLLGRAWPCRICGQPFVQPLQKGRPWQRCEECRGRRGGHSRAMTAAEKRLRRIESRRSFKRSTKGKEAERRYKRSTKGKAAKHRQYLRWKARRTEAQCASG
jgi:hypothetical protein